jgi:hypothetical protein
MVENDIRYFSCPLCQDSKLQIWETDDSKEKLLRETKASCPNIKYGCAFKDLPAISIFPHLEKCDVAIVCSVCRFVHTDKGEHEKKCTSNCLKCGKSVPNWNFGEHTCISTYVRPETITPKVNQWQNRLLDQKAKLLVDEELYKLNDALFESFHFSTKQILKQLVLKSGKEVPQPKFICLENIMANLATAISSNTIAHEKQQLSLKSNLH